MVGSDTMPPTSHYVLCGRNLIITTTSYQCSYYVTINAHTLFVKIIENSQIKIILRDKVIKNYPIT